MIMMHMINRRFSPAENHDRARDFYAVTGSKIIPPPPTISGERGIMWSGRPSVRCPLTPISRDAIIRT